MKHTILGVVCLAAALAGFVSCSPRRPGDETAGGREADPARTPAYRDPSVGIDKRTDDLLSRMTLEEKAAQTAQVARNFLFVENDLAVYGLGSVLSGGGSSPMPNRPDAWADMIDGYQEKALESRLGIPILYGADAVHGHNNLVGAVIFPHNIGLGAAGDPGLVERVARITAKEALATGVRWNFGPCVAVPRDERWGRTYEGFSEDPDLVSVLAAAAVRGYQSGGLGASGAMLATAKHYAADGGTDGGVDQGNFPGDESELRAVHLPPYAAAVDAGVGSVMASFSSWKGEKVHGHTYLLTDILRNELGFDGFVVSDWAALNQLPGSAREQIRAALEAGIDMVMLPAGYEDYIAEVVDLVESGDLDERHLDRAVRNILKVKFAMGLFERPFADRSGIADIGSAAHRKAAREAVRKSLVLLKNDGVLPLAEGALVGLAGSKADDLGSQCGGWTVTWQGDAGDITEGTTIREALEEALGRDGLVYSKDGDFSREPDVVICVVGEKPYAEFEGDRDDLRLDSGDRRLIERLSAGETPLVTLLVSGRPMIVTDELARSDAFMALWLPGTEGGGVADVLLEEPPSGRLPHSWPASMEQIPVNAGDGKEPLYPLGYGLSW